MGSIEHSGRRRQVVAGTLAAGLATAALAALPSQAAEPAGATDAPADRTWVENDLEAGTVTLITGDRVVIERHGDRSTVRVEAREAGQGIAYSSYTDAAGDLHVLPADVTGLIGPQLDPDLFNVSLLQRDGYGDASRSTLPVIVEYTGAPASVPGLEVVRQLASIGGAAATVDKAGARTLGRTLAAAAEAKTALAGVEHIFLDGKMHASLDESVPQVGAPAVWADGDIGAGVSIAILDTGIDEEHPDLAGRVVASEIFSDSPTATDKWGHGTHVASIAAGDGSASDGRYRGVAYGADLINAKVLDDFGEGAESWVIAGMEWAAIDQDADVVNVSVNGGSTDGTDPVSEAVNTLSAETDALFVVSAGDYSEEAPTVRAPATADAALAVGSVDKSDNLSGFTTVGPRPGRVAVKPEIVAPGEPITAARAAGTGLGLPVDEYYTEISGTSMSAPHVAGAAALLRAAKPDLTWSQVKAALVTSAVDLPPVPRFWQGGGRLDVSAAVDQQVSSDAATIDLGTLTWPHDDGETLSRAVTLSNAGDADIAVDLQATAANLDGEPAPPDSMITVSPQTLVIPAGGTAVATVTFDPLTGPDGIFAGLLNVRGDGRDLLGIPLSFAKDVERHTLTVAMTDVDGGTSFDGTLAWLSLDDNSLKETMPVSSETSVVSKLLPVGSYSLVFESYQDLPTGPAVVDVSRLDVQLAGELTVALDSRTAQEITAEVAEPATRVDGHVGYRRGNDFGLGDFGYVDADGLPGVRVFATPTDPVLEGFYDFVSAQTLVGADASYHLVFPESGQIPSDLTYPAGPEQLARVDHELHADVGGRDYWTSLFAVSSNDFPIPSSYFAVPGGAVHTAWVSAGGTVWQESFAAGDSERTAEITSLDNLYEAGTVTTKRWFADPVRPATRPDTVPLTRWHDLMIAELFPFVDADANFGFADQNVEEPSIDKVSYKLTAGGEVVSRGLDFGGQIVVEGLPPESTEYELTTQTHRDAPWWLTSTDTQTTWRFESGATPDVVELTLLEVDYDIPLDIANHAPAGPVPVRFDVTVPSAETHPADVTAIDAWASVDDGDSWTRLDLDEVGPGSFGSTVDVPATCEASCYVSLRVSAEEDGGSAIDQTITRAFVAAAGDSTPTPTASSPTPSVTASSPTGTSTPTPTGTLPGTGGGNATGLAGLGLVALLLGGVVVVAARRVRQ